MAARRGPARGGDQVKTIGFLRCAVATLALAGGCGGSSSDGESGCGGAVLGGACWYKGALGESCTQVCAPHGGYSAATASWAGSPTAGDRTNEANCQAVAAALSSNP